MRKTRLRQKAQGHLLAYKPPSFETIDASIKDSDGAFYGVQVIAMPYMFNSQHVKEGDVPNSANDFLKPIFNDKNVTPYLAGTQKHGVILSIQYRSTASSAEKSTATFMAGGNHLNCALNSMSGPISFSREKTISK
jgi:ABC-type Fe3+ transport system substrate-binding protein